MADKANRGPALPPIGLSYTLGGAGSARLRGLLHLCTSHNTGGIRPFKLQLASSPEYATAIAFDILRRLVIRCATDLLAGAGLEFRPNDLKKSYRIGKQHYLTNFDDTA
jgi:hypothetical protein